MDPSARYIDHARRTRPGIFLVGDLRRVELPAERFDQALIVERLHPLPDPDARALLAEARRMLVRGGRALVVERVRGRRDLAGRLRERLGRPPRAADDYQRLLCRAGRVERSEIFGSRTSDYLATLLGKEGPAPSGGTG